MSRSLESIPERMQIRRFNMEMTGRELIKQIILCMENLDENIQVEVLYRDNDMGAVDHATTTESFSFMNGKLKIEGDTLKPREY